MKVNCRSNKDKLIDKLQNKVRLLEKKNNGMQAEHEKAKGKVDRENQQLKERLDAVTNMNISL